MVSLLFTYESVSGALARRGPAGSQFPEKGSTVSNAEAWLFGCSGRLTLGGEGEHPQSERLSLLHSVKPGAYLYPAN